VRATVRPWLQHTTLHYITSIVMLQFNQNWLKTQSGIQGRS
jgi:hypothetical protein